MFNDLTACFLRVERQMVPVARVELSNGYNNSYINTNIVTFVIKIGNVSLFYLL